MKIGTYSSVTVLLQRIPDPQLEPENGRDLGNAVVIMNETQ